MMTVLFLPATTMIYAVLLATFALARAVPGSVTEQFGLKPYRGDVSDCFLACHVDVTSSIPAPWMEDGVNFYSRISKNCEYQLYLDTLALCLVQECKNSWDVQYAVEYGTAVCRKGGVKNVIIPISPSYTATAGGYYATAPANIAALIASSAEPRFDAAVHSLLLGVGGAVLGTAVVLAL